MNTKWCVMKTCRGNVKFFQWGVDFLSTRQKVETVNKVVKRKGGTKIWKMNAALTPEWSKLRF